MLANPHWNAPSLSSFESWLETKDPQESYIYSDCNICAVAQYLKHVGKFDRRWLSSSKAGDVVQTLNHIAADDAFDGSQPYKFGRLLERVRNARRFENALV